MLHQTDVQHTTYHACSHYYRLSLLLTVIVFHQFNEYVFVPCLTFPSVEHAGVCCIRRTCSMSMRAPVIVTNCLSMLLRRQHLLSICSSCFQLLPQLSAPSYLAEGVIVGTGLRPLMINPAAASSPSPRSGPNYLNPTLPTSRSTQRNLVLQLACRTDTHCLRRPTRSLAHSFEPLKVSDIPLLQQLEGLANKLLKLLAAALLHDNNGQPANSTRFSDLPLTRFNSINLTTRPSKICDHVLGHWSYWYVLRSTLPIVRITDTL